MSVRLIYAAAPLATLLAMITSATAADLSGPPVVALSVCGSPPAAIPPPSAKGNFVNWMFHTGQPRITDVEAFDTRHPQAVVVPKYVVPQIAYLASPLCQFTDEAAARSWYDGKLFYIQGGNRAAPDTFMVIERK